MLDVNSELNQSHVSPNAANKFYGQRVVMEIDLEGEITQSTIFLKWKLQASENYRTLLVLKIRTIRRANDSKRVLGGRKISNRKLED